MDENQQPTGQNEIEDLLREYQNLQNQLKGAAMQMDQFQVQKSDAEIAHQEVEKSTGKVYITVGGIMVETTKEEALKNISEKSEVIGIRLQNTTKMYKELQEKEKRLREQLTKLSEQQK
jgi:chaperonin cofactor prefoldin